MAQSKFNASGIPESLTNQVDFVSTARDFQLGRYKELETEVQKINLDCQSKLVSLLQLIEEVEMTQQAVHQAKVACDSLATNLDDDRVKKFGTLNNQDPKKYAAMVVLAQSIISLLGAKVMKKPGDFYHNPEEMKLSIRLRDPTLNDAKTAMNISSQLD